MFWDNWFGKPGSLSVSKPAGALKPAVKAPPKHRSRRPRHRGRGAGGVKIKTSALPPSFPFRPVVLVAAAGMPLRLLSAAVAKFADNATSTANAVLGDQVGGWASSLAQQWRKDADALQDVCRTFAVRSVSDLQDVLNSMVLAECVYKAIDEGPEGGARMLSHLKAKFPLGLVSMHSVQWALPHVTHRYLVAESDTSVYVAFMGTKQRRDLFTNANVLQEVVWDDLEEVPGQGVHQGAPAAHRGFLRRARAVPIESLYLHAHRKGKRLVLCGHSLGGAVATLCTVRLLQHLPPPQRHNVQCYGFATPPVGNVALSSLVQKAGWDQYIHNYMLPEDVIPRILTFARRIDHHGTVAYRPEGAGAAGAEASSTAAAAAGVAGLASSSSSGAPALRAMSLPVASVAVGAAHALDRSHMHTGAGGGGSGGSRGGHHHAAAQHPPPLQQTPHVAAPRLQVPFWRRGGKQQHVEQQQQQQQRRRSEDNTGLPPAASSSGRGGPAAAVAAAAATVVGRRGRAQQQQQQQANNILAPSASQMERLKGFVGRQQQQRQQQQLASVSAGATEHSAAAWAAAGAAGAPSLPGSSGAAAPEPSSDPSGSSDRNNNSSSNGDKWHTRVARTASLGVSKAAQLVASPMRATRAYVPVGRQLYVLPHNVSRTLLSQAEAEAAAAAAVATEAAASAGEQQQQQQQQGGLDPAAAAVAAADDAAAASPQQQRRRVLFLMHRMASYRARVLAILIDSLGAERIRRDEAPGRRGAGVLLSADIAPRLRPYSATGFVAAVQQLQQRQRQQQAGAAAAGSSSGGGNSDDAPAAPAAWSWPWAHMLPGANARDNASSPATGTALVVAAIGGGNNGSNGTNNGGGRVDVLVRITGQGLENCSRVDLAAGSSGAALTADVVAKPVPPLPLQLHRGQVAQLAGPLLEAWHVAKAWVGRDPLLVRVSVPHAMLREWADAQRAAAAGGPSRRLLGFGSIGSAAGGDDGKSSGTGGGSGSSATASAGGAPRAPPKLAVRLVGDFQVVELPLKLEPALAARAHDIGGGGSNGRGAGGGGRGTSRGAGGRGGKGNGGNGGSGSGSGASHAEMLEHRIRQASRFFAASKL